MRGAGRVYRPSRPPFLGAASIFREDATVLARASAEEIAANHYSEKLANQCYYAVAAQEGKFFGYAGMGYAGYAEGFANVLNCVASVAPVYYVPPSTPRVKVWFVEESGAEETLRAAGAANNLQAAWESVPIPEVSDIPHGLIAAEGTDRRAILICPATDEMWMFHRFGQFLQGTHQGGYKAGFGGYIPSLAASNGVLPLPWGNSASGLVGEAGAISMGDIVNVMRGGKIGHALTISVPVVSGHLAPAVRSDIRENVGVQNGHNVEFMANGTTPNPSYGAVDSVPEGLQCAFPAESSASEHGISSSTEPLASAMYEAMREFGLLVRDNAPNVSFYFNDARTLGTPYSETPVNAFAGITSPHGGNTATQVAAYVNAHVPAGWTDPGLAALDEEFHGTTSVLSKMPWRTLEQLAPRES